MFGLTEEQLAQIESDYEAVPAGMRASRPLPENPEEQVCLKFLYAYMPASDFASYGGAFFRKMVQDTLSVRRALPWGGKIPAELFLNYVLPPRVNNEDLSDYREPFFLELFPRVRGLSMLEAALEVNYWCLEKATYRSTDIRTNSPLSVVRSAHGRCGEESTLCVAALRSVGIPARQCYTPRWAHCDDNHAWVEVWTGEWHYIGACEPEAVPDRGWFTEPASRGMLIHAKAFSHLISEPDVTNRTPVMSQINILSRYAPTKRLEVLVTDGTGQPVPDAEVRFELVNFAQLFPLAVVRTDAQGKAHLVTGCGDLNVHVSKGGRFLHQKAGRSCAELRFCMEDAVTFETEPYSMDMVPPVGSASEEAPLSPEETSRHEARIADANRLREAYVGTFLRGEAARKLAESFPEFHSEIERLLVQSCGNHEEIVRFLRQGCGFSLRSRVMLLRTLREKDLGDCTCAVLSGHLRGAEPFRNGMEETLFARYVLCPRVAFETLTDYRDFLTNYFSGEQREAFRRDPETLYEWIETEIADSGDREYETVTASPQGLLELKCGGKLSREILFVAVCRTFGIPSRLSETDGKPEYWQDGEWHAIAGTGKALERNSTLILKAGTPGLELVNEKNFTVARLENGVYRTLGVEGSPDGNTTGGYVRLRLEAGHYRVTTANRLRDGAVLSEFFFVELAPNEERELSVAPREPGAAKDEGVSLPAIPVRMPGADGGAFEARLLLPKGETCVLAFLRERAEPTEHLLNEVLEQSGKFSAVRKRILFLVQGPESLKDRLLSRTLSETEIPAAFWEDDGSLGQVLGALGSKNSKLPLVMGLDAEGRCVFHLSGYNVGTGDLLLWHLEDKTAND